MVQFDATDLDNATSESGVVHESVANTDHGDASTLKQGYSFESPLYSSALTRLYALQEDSGSTAYDYSGNNNDGSYTSVTVNQSGLLGTSSVDFQGGYMQAPSVSLSGEFSVLAWINRSAGGGINPRYVSTISGSSTGFEILTDAGYLNGDNSPSFRVGDGSSFTAVDSSRSLVNGEWRFIAGTYDGSTMRLYDDAVLEDSASTSYSGSSEFLTVGDNPTNLGGDNFNGRIGPVWVASREFTQSELQDYYDVVATAGSLTTQFKSV